MTLSEAMAAGFQILQDTNEYPYFGPSEGGIIMCASPLACAIAGHDNATLGWGMDDSAAYEYISTHFPQLFVAQPHLNYGTYFRIVQLMTMQGFRRTDILGVVIGAGL